jgi:hypothetical protein
MIGTSSHVQGAVRAITMRTEPQIKKARWISHKLSENEKCGYTCRLFGMNNLEEGVM